MKTLLTILGTTMTTLVITTIVLFNMNIITIEEVQENHTTQTYIDGVLVENNTWDVLKGINIKVNVVDNAYIGK